MDLGREKVGLQLHSLRQRYWLPVLRLLKCLTEAGLLQFCSIKLWTPGSVWAADRFSPGLFSLNLCTFVREYGFEEP